MAKQTKKTLVTQEQISKKRLELNELGANFEGLSEKDKKTHEALALEIGEMEEKFASQQRQEREDRESA
jgi:hypothetical protein